MKRYYAKNLDGMVEWFGTKTERDAFCVEEFEYGSRFKPCTSTEARRTMLAMIWETDRGRDNLRGVKAWWERHACMREVIELYTDCCKFW